jgi:hypothetical protein
VRIGGHHAAVAITPLLSERRKTMKLEFPKTLLALALCGAWGSAQATETAFHNDMDGDGHSDLIWRNASTGAIVYWSGANQAVPRRLSIRPSDLALDQQHVSPLFAVSDFWNIPQRAMLVMRDSVTGYDYGLYPSWENPAHDYGFGSFGAGVDASAAGDFNGDGVADVFYRNPGNGQNYIMLSAGYCCGWYPPEAYPTLSVPTVTLAWNIAGIGDFDGDESSDILWRNAATGRNAIWRSGSYATQLSIGSVVNLDWKIAAVGDFNGDLRSDILWRNSRTGANVIWKSGSYRTPQAVSSVTNLAWKVVATGDFNGDGKWDLVWRNSSTGANIIWKSANAATRQTLPTVALTWSAVM